AAGQSDVDVVIEAGLIVVKVTASGLWIR
ncbi:MAG: hypothetical protein ACI9HX_000628, partial [Pseudoalteromonas tetraodonis]